MTLRQPSSRRRYRQYKRDLKAHRTEGSRPPAALASPASRENQRQRSFFALMGSFLGLLVGHRLTMGLALGTLSVATLLNLALPLSTKLIVDYAIGDKPLPSVLERLGVPEARGDRLAVFVGAVVAVSLVGIGFGLWGRWQATRITQRLKASIRRRVFEHAVRLPLHRVYEMKSGGVASMLREDAGGVPELIFSMLYNPWRAIVQLSGSLVMLAVVDWRLLIGSLLAIPSVYLTHRTWIARIRPVYRDIRASRQHIDSSATEAFGGMRVVRSFGRQQSEAARFTRNNHFLVRQEILAWWWSRGVDIAWSVLLPVATAALLWYGGARVLAGALTLGDLMMFIMYLAWMLAPLATLAASATALQNSLAALDRVLDLLKEPLDMPPRPGALRVQAARVAGRITLRGVSFVYPGSSTRVLEGIDLDAEPGRTVALVGPSGSGKTTLCNLIARFYDPVEGRIELDGTDLREIDVDSYRRLLGVVEQDIFLFDGTVAQNIGYARRGATMDQIVEMARLAHADEFITDLDRGYETVIGERGVRLSGGQRQRLAIARALLADPRILILDEATSSLDSESERLIQASLRELMEGRTSFVIAHRLSTITHADHIVVLDGGCLVEQGTHEELLARSGRYGEMVEAQLAPLAEVTAKVRASV